VTTGPRRGDPPGTARRVALRGVLLDLDGTLVETSGAWRGAYLATAAARGTTLPEDWWERVVGRSMRASTAVLGVDPEAAADADEVAGLVAELTARGAAELTASPPAWRPGAAALVAGLTAAGIPLAVVTSVEAPAARPILAALDLAPAALVVADGTSPGKPAPDPYLRAAALLGLRPDDCLAVEDSPSGVAAAEAAGVPVLVVPSALSVGPGPGREVRPTLEGIGVEDLVALHARLRSVRADEAADAGVAADGATSQDQRED